MNLNVVAGQWLSKCILTSLVAGATTIDDDGQEPQVVQSHHAWQGIKAHSLKLGWFCF
jgi:hypothetical protein